MNLKRWNGLTAAQQKIMQDTIIEHENYANTKLKAMAADERKTLVVEGMQFHNTPNPDAYLKLAIGSAYERMLGHLKKAERPMEHVQKLRDAYQD